MSHTHNKCTSDPASKQPRAESQLREKTALLQNITDNMLDMVAITDLEGRFTYAGSSHRILGFEPVQFVGTSVFDYVHPDDVEYIAGEFAEFVANPAPDATRTVEYRQRCADGSYLWLEVKGKILVDDNGTPYSLFFNSRDVTERKHAVNALRTAEALQRKMVANIGDVIVIIDEHGIIRYKSPNIEKWFEWKPNDLVGAGFLEYVHPEDRGSADQILRSVLNVPNDTRTMECRYRCKDGRYKWIQITSVNLLHDPDIKGILGNYRDITERKQAEQLFQEREQYLTSILRTTADGFWVVDEYGKLLDVNDAYCRMSGYTQTELLAMAISDLDALEAPEDTQERIRQIMAKGSAIFETLHRRKDGSVFDMEISVTHQNIKDGQFVCFGRDITDRKEAIDALQESEGRFKTIIENLPGGVFMHDFDGRLLLANEAASKNTGYSIRELLALNVSDIDSGGYPREDREKLWNSLNIGELLTIESWHTRKDGSQHPVEIHLNAIMFDKQPAILAIAFDITERKRTEEALRESEDKLREAQTIAGLGRWDLDLSTGDLLWSEGIFDLFEISPENFAASYDAFLDFVHPDDRGLVHNAFQDSVESRRPYEIEHRLLMNDGRIKWVNEIGRTEYDELGNPICAFGTVQDITERKLVEENLRDRNLFIETVLDNLPIGLAINRIQEGVATYMNRQFERIYGWPKEEITNRDFFFEKAYPDPAYRNQIITQVLKDIATGDPARMRWENIEATAKDGTKRIIVAQNIPLVEQNIMISTVQDETQRVLAEKQRNNLQAQLAQAQKMESVGRLAGGVAHDYNNMLSVISGYTELALEKLQPGDPLHSDLTEVYKAAARSTDITRQLLAFARKQTIAPKVIDLNAIVESMLRMLRRLIGEDIKLAWHPGKRLWTVKMDPAQVDQILANLCVNARDAIGGVGKVTIETDNTSIDADYCETHSGFAPGEFVMLIVSDNGCGMDPETLQHIYEPFYSTKGAEEGTGLGLATVYGIVKQNAGHINVYSEPGQGTTFRIFLPRHVGDMQPKQIHKKTATPVSHGETVLLVEDEPSILRMGKIMLRRLGYDVLAAGTPQMAMDLAREHAGEIDLLITDVVMPELNGRELAEQLSALYPRLKTMFMSGYTADVIAHRGVLEEGMDFIQKPFSLHDLGRKIRSILDA